MSPEEKGLGRSLPSSHLQCVRKKLPPDLIQTLLSAPEFRKLALPKEEQLAVLSRWISHPNESPVLGGLALGRRWEIECKKQQVDLSGEFPAFDLASLLLPKGNHEHFKTSPAMKPPSKPLFTFIDIFAGIGGFRLALERCGGKCVFSSEKNNAARITYLRNFGEYPFGDITRLTRAKRRFRSLQSLSKIVPDHDVLAAGFPCQPFSLAGVSARRSLSQAHGFECEDQGQLFFDLMRLIKAKRPRVLILENVKNVRTHDGTATFSRIRREIESLGYSFSAAIIDASTLVPQRRKRCYMVCVADTNERFQFPLQLFRGEAIPLKTALEVSVSPEFTISDRLWKGHVRRTKRNRARGVGFTVPQIDIELPAPTLVARYGKDGKECLIPQPGRNPRMLTPRECARLQGFPDNFLVPDAKTPAYHQFGNSVAVPVVEALCTAILELL